MTAPTADQLRFILESGILAPSADNHHCLRFEAAGSVLNVRYDGPELPTTGGYKRALALFSLGAVAENLAVASSRYGLGTEAALLPDPTRPDLIIQIRWGKAEGPCFRLWDTIRQRHTNRAIFYGGPKLAPPELKRLEGLPLSLSGSTCRVIWLDEPRLRLGALRLIHRAETERFRNRWLHEELFSAVRFDVGWNQSSDTGLPPGALGVERLLRPTFSALRHWPLMRLVNLMGGCYVLGWRAAALPCRLAPHLGVIAVADLSDRALFAAGRSLQRLWLEITQLGMALQPILASTLYALEGAPQEHIPRTLQQRLRQEWTQLIPAAYPAILFRLGRAAPPRIVTGRQPMEHYLRA